MILPAQSQVAAALRYAATAAGTVGSVVVLIGIVPPDTAHKIVDASQKLMEDLQPVVGDLYLLAGLIGPIVVAFIAKMGWNSANPKSQAAVVQSRGDMQVLTSNPDIAKDVPGIKLVPPSQINS